MTSGAFAQNDCRLQPSDFQPMIARFNPFFSDHRWEDYKKMETARLDKDRLLVISQTGCKRHHTSFVMIISPRAVTHTDDFWIDEAKSLMNAVFFQNPTYSIFKKEFEEAFEEKFRIYGINSNFNFPVGTRNFICEVKYDPIRGANLRIELVQFIFQESIQKKTGIPHEQDDGWFNK
jgi:hypothetical protein